jgi:DNA-3-methyladenine glycosylase
MAGMIVETEAYLGQHDSACHASFGKTERTRLFYDSEPAATVYVFSSYGIYNCLNVLTAGEDPAGCVLIRALEPLLGIDIMMRNRRIRKVDNLTSGPGKLTDAFAISKCYNGHRITEEPLVITDWNLDGFTPGVGPRIGISKAKDYPLRFFLTDSPFVSR